MIDILENAINEYDPRYVIAMFSGGHDSLVATHIASQHPRFSFALHINTGIGIEQTRHFVRETCKEWGIELREYRASEYVRADGNADPQNYDELVIERGFPGPYHHTKMYNRLKERPLRMALRDLELKRGDVALLVTGIRSQESTRRMAHVETLQHWEGGKYWVAPIHDYSKIQVNDYIERYGLRRNPVVDMLHMSGECLCGAYAHPGEKEEIRFWFPDVAAQLDDLERRVNAAGFPWGWEDGPPSWWTQHKAGQGFLPGMKSMLCQTCEWRQELPPEDAGS